MIKKIFISLLIIFTLIPTAQTFAAERTKKNVVSYSKKFIGTKYLYGGTTTKGFDCSGYTRHVYKNFNHTLPRSSSDQYKKGKTISKSKLAVGDLVFFATSKAKKVSHVGIYIGNNKFIHSATSKGVSIAKINDPYYWGSKYVGAKRVLAFS